MVAFKRELNFTQNFDRSWPAEIRFLNRSKKIYITNLRGIRIFPNFKFEEC